MKIGVRGADCDQGMGYRLRLNTDEDWGRGCRLRSGYGVKIKTGLRGL